MRSTWLGMVSGLAVALCACGGSGTPADPGPGDLPVAEVPVTDVAEAAPDPAGGETDVPVRDPFVADEASAPEEAEVAPEPTPEAEFVERIPEADEGPVEADEPGTDESEDGAGEAADLPDGIDASDVCNDPACLPCPDDGLECTDEVHGADGKCTSVLKDGFCLIGGACWFLMQPDPARPCMFCVPEVDTGAFVPHSGEPCDADGDPCTVDDACDDTGVCQAGPPATAATCDDSNPCTNDACKPKVGCIHANVDLPFCNDHNACTLDDHCEAGVCGGAPLDCDDKNDCTDDSCDPELGCVNAANTVACDDMIGCTVDDHCQDKACHGVPKDCDDGDPCTVDGCSPGANGDCTHTYHYGACDDHDACTTGDLCNGAHQCVGDPLGCDDYNECTTDVCDSSAADEAHACQHLPVDNGTGCVIADPCMVGATCQNGVCTGVPIDCTDSDKCTLDSCDQTGGCRHDIITGPCDDGDACTVGETCGTGICTGGVALDCDDGNACTQDDCDRTKGCIHQIIQGPCDDGDSCTRGDQCVGGLCLGTRIVCDDVNPCTADSCSALGECVHTPMVEGANCTPLDACQTAGHCRSGACVGTRVNCDDGNDCTLDSCDPTYGCLHKAVNGTCDDHSVCTTADHCEAGVCVGTPIVCDDNDPCTDNLCDPLGGCWYDAGFTGPCDDGNACTTGDQCTSGRCTGKLVFTDPIAKAGRMAFGASGNPGQGLDVDGNPATCSPAGNCLAGVDDAFAKIAWLFTPEVTKAVAAGQVALMLEPRGMKAGGGTFQVKLYYGQRIPSTCDPTSGGCRYLVASDDLQNGCDPRWNFDNARIDAGKLVAGGKGYAAPVFLVLGVLRIRLTMQWARIEGTVTTAGSAITGGTAVLGGALSKQAAIDAVSAVAASSFPPPYTRDLVVGYLQKYLEPDMDVDGDGTNESVSVGLPLTLVTGTIVGKL